LEISLHKIRTSGAGEKEEVGSGRYAALYFESFVGPEVEPPGREVLLRLVVPDFV